MEKTKDQDSFTNENRKTSDSETNFLQPCKSHASSSDTVYKPIQMLKKGHQKCYEFRQMGQQGI